MVDCAIVIWLAEGGILLGRIREMDWAKEEPMNVAGDNGPF
jgi:hypothetical protein